MPFTRASRAALSRPITTSMMESLPSPRSSRLAEDLGSIDWRRSSSRTVFRAIPSPLNAPMPTSTSTRISANTTTLAIPFRTLFTISHIQDRTIMTFLHFDRRELLGSPDRIFREKALKRTISAVLKPSESRAQYFRMDERLGLQGLRARFAGADAQRGIKIEDEYLSVA